MSGALAYANCMRSHGVPDFPDPNGQGEFQLHTKFENGRPTRGEDLIASSPAFQAAERACGPLGSAGRQVTATQEEQTFQKELKAAACMRANGVPNYPDPKLIDGSIDQEFNGKIQPGLTRVPASRQEVREARRAARWDPPTGVMSATTILTRARAPTSALGRRCARGLPYAPETKAMVGEMRVSAPCGTGSWNEARTDATQDRSRPGSPGGVRTEWLPYRMAWPSASRLPSLSKKNAPRSPVPLLG